MKLFPNVLKDSVLFGACYKSQRASIFFDKTVKQKGLKFGSEIVGDRYS